MAAHEAMRPSISTTATLVMSKNPRLMSFLTLACRPQNRNDIHEDIVPGLWPQASYVLRRGAYLRIHRQQGIAPMPKRSMRQDDPLEDFTRRDIALDGVTNVVYVAGAGP